MSIPQAVRSEIVSVSRDMTVLEAVQTMTAKNIGSVMVMEQGTLVGVFTERDLMTRVVAEQKDPREVRLSEVMTPDPVTISIEETLLHAMQVMQQHHVRHLPLINPDGTPDSVLTMRNLQAYKYEQLRQENDLLAALVKADGPGG